MSGLPLAGVRVVEIGDAWAGPYTATLLADLGADAIRVETVRRRPAIVRGQPTDAAPHPLYPDFNPGAAAHERHIFLHAVDHNKRSITLDLKDPRGAGLMQRLLDLSDVFVYNFTPSALRRLGLHPDELRTRHPRLIIASVLGFGLGGESESYVSVGSTTDGFCGHSYLRGYPDTGPLDNTAILHTDSVAGITAVVAICAALRQRDATGEGCLIDLSQAEATTAHFAHALTDYGWNGRIAGPSGNAHRVAAPHNTYRCAPAPGDEDGPAAPPAGDERWIAIACFTDAQWHALVEQVADPALATDPAFRTGLRRWRHREQIDARLDAWTAEKEPVALARRLQAAGVPAQPLMTAHDLMRDRQVEARGFLTTAPHPDIGERVHPRPFFTFDGERPPLRRAASTLGQDNADILQGLLGVDEAEYRSLIDADVVGDRFVE